MKKMLSILAIVATLTACAKSEVAAPAPAASAPAADAPAAPTEQKADAAAPAAEEKK